MDFEGTLLTQYKPLGAQFFLRGPLLSKAQRHARPSGFRPTWPHGPQLLLLTLGVMGEPCTVVLGPSAPSGAHSPSAASLHCPAHSPVPQIRLRMNEPQLWEAFKGIPGSLPQSSVFTSPW